ncbi:ubiquitin-specific protease 23 [Perilla frutescens var. hirtella]|uniref:Ubiquitin carboxyl-terminal hydrolase n=1 Tax=Perilla frutescens var. hirtella TaxID=608512 RepID=A0AAD4J8G2_PERFH|nr:ubiquitin-specific protease 23 [Perilla frutescens var. hirtella]
MGETAAMINSDRVGGPEGESDSTLFHRRIEFHQARKHFGGFENDSTNGFKLVTLNPSSEPVKAFGWGKKTEKSSEFSEAGLDPELSFEITFRRIGAGLRNLGNTCFLNSVLQCLTYTAPLAAYLQSGKHQSSCRTSGFCALCAIQKHVSRALQSTGRILEPKDLVSNLRCISRSFRNARQEDAHEYMVNLLESMHKCCLPSGVSSESPGAYDKSLVHKIFGGRLRSQVKCMQCSYCSNKFDPFLDLSLEIVRADSLHKALDHFTAKELLDGGAREYQCDQCKQKVKALKQLTIHKAPQVLAVHLKRFSSHAPGQKIDRKVAFGTTLDLKPFVTGPYDGDLNYTLYGVLVHYGWSTHSGHYYCFVRTSSGMWYSLDDNQVVQVNERKVLEQKAYMLFYVRDRKNVGAKIHVNALKRENMVMNAIGNAAYSKFNVGLEEKIQNGANEKKLYGCLSATLSGRDALVTPLPKDIPSEKMSASNINGKLTVEHLGHVSNSNSESLMVPPSKVSMREHSVMEINSVGCKGDTSSSIDGSGGTSNLGHVAENITCNNTLSAVEKQITTAIILPDCSRQQDSVHKKESSDFVGIPSGCEDSGKEKPSEPSEKPPNNSILSTSSGESCKMDGTISAMNDNKIMPMGAIGEPLNKINDMLSSPQKNIADRQVDAPSIKTFAPKTEEAVENGQRMDDMQSKLLSDLPATIEHVSLGITKTKRRDLKVKRKLLKCQVVTTSLSSNIILGAGLCLRKKRHRQRRHRSMQKNSPKMKDLLGQNDLPSKLVQSETEESFLPVVDHCTSFRKKKTKYVSDGENQNLSTQEISGGSSISGDIIDNDFRERVLRNGSAVSAEKQPQIRQSASQVTGISEECQRELRQTDVMSILTRGVEETTVARWDDIGVSLSKKSETRAARIGYVGDEWDEEYDRGKRKKVRGPKVSFDGPNLFQEIATQREKRAKLDRSRGGNQPFRIRT